MRKIKGVVISDKMQGSAVVKVDRAVSHPLYKKHYTVSKKYKVENLEDKYKIGDMVEITESTPLSRTKRFAITKKLGDALVKEELAEDEVKEAAKIRVQEEKKEVVEEEVTDVKAETVVTEEPK